MVSNNLRMLYVVTTVLIVYESSLSPSYAMLTKVTAAGASSLKESEMDVNSRSHTNNPTSITGTGMFNRMPRHIIQGQQQQQQLHQQQDLQQSPYADEQRETDGESIKRSYSISGGSSGSLASTLNGLTSLSGFQHIRSGGYDAAVSSGHQNTHQPSSSSSYTEAKPIYEEQQEQHDYAPANGNSQHYGGGAATNTALHSAIYNLQTAGTHNAGALGSGSGSGSGMAGSSVAYNGGSDGFLPSWNFGKLSTSFTASAGASTPYQSYHHSGGGLGGAATGTDDNTSSSSNNDKISEGNFLHHYDSASGYNEFTHQLQQQQRQQQHQYQSYEQQSYQQHPQHDDYINSVEHAAASSSSYGDDGSEHDHVNYLPPSGGGGDVGGHQEQKQPDVINYVPYPVVKKLHVPVHEPVQIPVSHAVIIPVSKPVPIHIPVTQNVQVPVEKELKIPVERVVPYPVEKHVPVPVEKRVPYPVVKYVPIKVPRPFPVKVPVFKTVLHKVKGWW